MAEINSNAFDFNSLEISMLGNNSILEFSAIEYGVKQNKSNNYGRGGNPTSRARGNKEYSGSITLSMKEIVQIRQAAQSRGYDNLTEIPPFNLVVSYANGTDPTTTDILEFCEFDEDMGGGAQGSTNLEKTLPLVIGCIRFNS